MRSAVTAALRVLLGGLFVYAALTKVGDMRGFAEEVANYQLLPAALVPGLAAAQVGIELLAGALLVLGLRARAAATVIAVMLALFIAALSQSLLRGIDLRCGCFGGAETASWATVWRDVALLGVALLLCYSGGGRLFPVGGRGGAGPINNPG